MLQDREDFSQAEGPFIPAPRPLENRNTDKLTDEQARARSRESIAGCMRQQGRYKEAQRFEDCGRIIKAYCSGCGYSDPKVRVFRCGLRECQECSTIESNRLFNRIIDRVCKTAPVAGWRWRHIVLTSRRDTTKSLKDDYIRVKFELNRLHTFFRKKEFSPGISAVGGIEFGPKNQMVHVHLFIFCKWLSKQQLKKVWRLGSCWFKRVVSERQTLNACLYSIDFSKMPDSMMIANIGLIMKKTRRVFTWGGLYGTANKDKKKKNNYVCPCCGEKMHWKFDQGGEDHNSRDGPAWS